MGTKPDNGTGSDASSGRGSSAGGERYDDTHGIGESAGEAGAPGNGNPAAPGAAAGPDVVGVANERVGLVDEASRPIPELSAQIEGQLDDKLGQITSWSELAGDGVDIAAMCFLPAWHLTDGERKRLGEKLGKMLDLCVPMTMGPKVQSVVALVMTAGAITVARVATNGGNLPPIGPQRAAPAAPAPTPSASSLTE